jgi:sugar lactone lactonase YvrE
LSRNTFLRDNSVRLFEGRVSGAESVAVAADGALLMLDKYGQVWEAKPTDSSSAGEKKDTKNSGSAAAAYDLSPTPVANLQSNGGGRPLGFHPDELTGDLYVCDSRRGLVVVEPAEKGAEQGEQQGQAPQRKVRDVATTIAPHSRARANERIPYANDLDLTHVRPFAVPQKQQVEDKEAAASNEGGKHGAGALAGALVAGLKARATAAVAAASPSSKTSASPILEPAVFFTSCTDIDPPFNAKGGFYDTMRGYQLDLAQGAPRGALLAWSPSLGGAVVVAEGLYYANGVALSKNGDYALVVETNRQRVLRVWLDGRLGGDAGVTADQRAADGQPKFREADISGPGGPGATLQQAFRVAPRVDVFADELPGVPDGVNIAGASRHFGDEEGDAFWVALIGPVPPISKLLGLAGIRAAYAWLPEKLRPSIKPWGAALRLRAADGQAETLLLDPKGESVSSVSAVTESADGKLFFGNLMGDYVSYVDLKAAGEWRRRSR